MFRLPICDLGCHCVCFFGVVKVVTRKVVFVVSVLKTEWLVEEDL